MILQKKHQKLSPLMIEKFKDDDNNIVEIETRGIREYDKIYFLVKDVSDGFGIDDLRGIIIHKNTTYTKNYI